MANSPVTIYGAGTGEVVDTSSLAKLNEINAFGAFNQTFDTDTLVIDAVSNKIGIGTETPEFKLDVDTNGGIIARGTFGSGDTLATSGAGTRFIWYPRKGAIRAGTVTGTEWDAANIGDYSVALGYNNKASNTSDVVAGGEGNISSGGWSVVGGGYFNTTSNDTATVAGGESNTASGNDSAVGGGLSNLVSGDKSVIGGGGTNTITGHYSVITGGVNNTIGSMYSSIIGGYWGTINVGANGSAIIGSYNGNNIVNGVQSVLFGSHNARLNGNYSVANIASDADITVTQNNTFIIYGTGSYEKKVGIQVLDPSARLHLGAGTATATESPLKLTTGVNLATPENGAVEYDGTNLYVTDSNLSRKPLNNQYVLASKFAINMDTSADQSITIPTNKYIIRRIVATNASIPLTTAAGGLYTAASKGGTAVVAASQAYTALTAASKFLDLTLETIVTTDILTATTLYFSLTTAQGAAATADIYIIGDRLDF